MLSYIMKHPKIKDLKTFALIWSLLFLIVGIYPLFTGNGVRLWAMVLMLLFILIAFSNPSLLNSFYKIWIKIGEFIGNIISKVIMVVLFYGLFTPIAFILKLLNKDLLKKKLDKNRSSYWIKRETQPGSLKNQF